MALLNQINDNLKSALKSFDQTQVDALRLLLSEVRNKAIDKKAKVGQEELTDEEIIGLIKKETKKRKEAIDFYNKGGRAELVLKETNELKILEKYLPEEASEAEIETVVKKVVEDLQPKSEKDFGKIIGESVKRLKDRADGLIVSRIVKRMI